MAQTFLHWLGSYGYAGLAVGVFLESMGLPLPGETALLVAAFAAGSGRLHLPIVIAVAAFAGILGDNLGYLLGRRLGRSWIERHGRRFFVTPERLARMDRFFDRFGPAAIALARFITGVRVVAAFAAGVARLAWGKFLAFNVLGALVWATTIGLLGYAAGRGSAAFGIQPWMFGALIGAVVLVTGAIAWLRRRLGQSFGDWLAEHWFARLFWWEVWVLSLSVSGLVLFAKIAEDVSRAESRGFDRAVAQWLLAHHSGVLAAAASAIGWLGSLLLVVPLALAISLWFWFRQRRPAPAVVLAAALLGSILMLGLKLAFHRGYPADTPPGPWLHYSFPSAHATTITAAALTTAYVLVRQRLAPWGLAVPIALLTLLTVGVSRVYLDLARATDVIGGWAVGLFVAAVAGTIYEKLGDRSRSP